MNLFPTWIIAVILYYILGKGRALIPTGKQYVKFSFVALILNLLGLHGCSQKYINIVPGGWYIGSLVLYYLVAPFIHQSIKTTSIAIKWCFGALMLRICLHGITNLFLTGDPLLADWMDMCVLNQFVFIALGQCLYFVFEKRDTKLSNIDQLLIIIGILYITLQVDSLMLWALFILCFVFLAAKHGNSILINKFALLIGKYSFEIYLTHNAVIYFVFKYITARSDNEYICFVLFFLVVCFSTMFVSIAFYHLVRLFKKKIQFFAFSGGK